MIIWFSLTIPILFAIGIILLFHRKVIWWEILIPLLISVLLTTIFKVTAGSSKVKDIEFWGNYVVTVCNYEDWNEYIHKTCEDCTTDEDGNTTCTTYDCSYVDYHPEYYTMILNSGKEITIKRKEYLRLKKKFGNNHFVELNRNYHTDDGDLWKSTYDESYEKFEFIATKHTYKNKVQASDDVFNFPDVDTANISFYELYRYPEIKNFYKLPAIIGPEKYSQGYGLIKKFDWVNGKLGMNKQLRVWVLIYENKPYRAGQLQEALWKRGNKNEFIISIGLDKDGNVQWCYPFSWTEVEILKIETRNFVRDMEKLDLSKLADFLYKELNEKFVRKPFADFDYLTVEPPLWSVIVTFGVVFLVNLLLSFWIVKNEFGNE